MNSRQMTHTREPAVGAHGQERAQFMNPIVRLISHAPNHAIFSNQVGHHGAHQEPEAGLLLRLFPQQSQ